MTIMSVGFAYLRMIQTALTLSVWPGWIEERIYGRWDEDLHARPSTGWVEIWNHPFNYASSKAQNETASSPSNITMNVGEKVTNGVGNVTTTSGVGKTAITERVWLELFKQALVWVFQFDCREPLYQSVSATGYYWVSELDPTEQIIIYFSEEAVARRLEDSYNWWWFAACIAEMIRRATDANNMVEGCYSIGTPAIISIFIREGDSADVVEASGESDATATA